MNDVDVPRASAERGGSAGSAARRDASRRGKARGEFNVAAWRTTHEAADHTERNGGLQSIRSSRERDGRKRERGGGGPRVPAPLRAAELSVGRTLASVARASIPRAAPRGTGPPARKRAPPARRRDAAWRGTGIAPPGKVE